MISPTRTFPRLVPYAIYDLSANTGWVTVGNDGDTAAFAIATVAILHSTVDFSLQIPAIGFIVSAVLGMGWAQAFNGWRAARDSATA